MAALAFAYAAHAQNTGSVNDYQLPPAPSSAPPPVQGPVDPENPATLPGVNAPAPQPAPPPSVGEPAPSSPQITLPATEPTQTRPQRTAPQARQGPQPAPDQPTGTPSPSASPETPSFEPAPAAPPPSAEVPVAPQEETAWNRWWLPALAGLLVLLAVAAFLWLRRRGATRPEEDVPAEAEPATPSASAPATLTPIRQTPAKAAPRPALVTGPLEFRLEPQTLRLSFVYATLSYQLDLTNREEAGFTALRIAGDLISGHASLPTWQQLSLDGQELEHKHDVLALAPGETVTLKGELRRPLAEILPLRAGTALLFAPLARFRVEATGGGAFADTRIFTIGQPSERAGGAMQPFRLDLGPQLFRQIDLREVDVARWLPLDETRRAS